MSSLKIQLSLSLFFHKYCMSVVFEYLIRVLDILTTINYKQEKQGEITDHQMGQST